MICFIEFVYIVYMVCDSRWFESDYWCCIKILIIFWFIESRNKNFCNKFIVVYDGV